ncbi:MAG: hypothetical protein KDA85_09365 [Planctomycetaceae bacterium]|nr:hypothetical protein [Planctomycetaceae bacterium]
MTATIQMPAQADVVELINDLLGLDTQAKPAQAAEICSIAEYVDGDGAAVGYMACDLASGCRLGAALTQVPAGRVDEAIKEKAIPDMLAENLGEIFNICVNLVTPEDGTRVVLGRTAHGASSPHYAELKERLDAATKVDIGMEVARYGHCTLIIAG